MLIFYFNLLIFSKNLNLIILFSKCVFMKVLGNILHIANSGKLIAKSSQTPPAGGLVFTDDKRKIGKVGDVFGPVKNPYVSVNLFKSANKRDLESRNGEKLFVSINNKKHSRNKNKKSVGSSNRKNKYKKSVSSNNGGKHKNNNNKRKQERRARKKK